MELVYLRDLHHSIPHPLITVTEKRTRLTGYWMWINWGVNHIGLILYFMTDIRLCLNFLTFVSFNAWSFPQNHLGDDIKWVFLQEWFFYFFEILMSAVLKWMMVDIKFRALYFWYLGIWELVFKCFHHHLFLIYSLCSTLNIIIAFVSLYNSRIWFGVNTPYLSHTLWLQWPPSSKVVRCFSELSNKTPCSPIYEKVYYVPVCIYFLANIFENSALLSFF